jgi:capsular polysaccharide biosynthesis protein
LLAVITGCIFVIGAINTFAIAKPTYKSNAAITVAIDYVSESTHQTTYDYTNSIRAVVTVANTIINNSIIDPVVERYNQDLKDGNNTLVLPSYKLKYPLDESKWQTVSSTALKEKTSKSLSEMVSVSYTTNSMMVTITVAAKNPIVSEYFADAIQT